MNILLLNPSDFTDQQHAVISDRRALHVIHVIGAEIDKPLRAGLINGATGTAIIVSFDENSVSLKVILDKAAIPTLPLTLILALPRPKMLKRILQNIATLGVNKLYLVNSYKVDKSYWSTPILKNDNYLEHLQLGLEQAGTTILPQLELRKRFKPFVEDEPPHIAADSRAIIAHPYSHSISQGPSSEQTTLAIGPEGGFTEYEVDKLIAAGFKPMSLGARILKVETAIPVAITKLF